MADTVLCPVKTVGDKDYLNWINFCELRCPARKDCVSITSRFPQETREIPAGDAEKVEAAWAKISPAWVALDH